MNKKIFQLFFFLIIITAFGVIIKNYVNSITSDLYDYRFALDKATEGEISRLAPITFHLAQDFDDDKFALNVPIKNDLIKFRPSIKGYVYFTDKRTIEFQPDEPLKPGTTYLGKLNVKKIFPTLLLKPYHFKFSTPALTFQLKIKETVYFDSIGNQSPYISGYINFNDYYDYDKKQTLLVAYQNNKPLPVNLYPGKNNQSLEFKISGIQRTNKNERVKLQWSGKAIKSKTNDSTSVVIASKNEFNVVYCGLKYFPEPILTIRFTNIVKKDVLLNSYLNITNLKDYNIDVNKNEISVTFNEITNSNHTLKLSKNLVSANNTKLPNDFKYTFKLSEPEPFISLANDAHYIPSEKSPNLTDIMVLNLKSFNVEIKHVSDNNMMQFLQVNDINTSREIERVGKTIFKKTFNLQTEQDYNPNELTTYNLNLLGANLSMSGLYCLTFSYKPTDIIYNRNSVVSNDNKTYGDEIVVTNVFKHNVIYSNILAIAKLTTKDSLYIFVSDLNSGLPIKEASVEIFDFQQHKIAAMLTNEQGIAAFKTTLDNLFIKVQNNADITYLKLNNTNTLSKNGAENSGIVANNGVMCKIEGLKPSYSPSDYLQIALILKENGKYITKKEHLEVKLESPDHFFFNTEVFTINSTDVKLYSTKFPSHCSTGNWNLIVSTELAEFNFPFQVENASKLMLPVRFNLDTKKKTLDIVDLNQQIILKNKPLITQITEIKSSKKKIPNSNLQTSLADSIPLQTTYKTNFDKSGKSTLNLPDWIKSGTQFNVSSKVEFPNEVNLAKDTLLLNQNENHRSSFPVQWQTDTTLYVHNNSVDNYNHTIDIQLDKNEYVAGDSCYIFFTSKNSEKALLTIESSTHLFYSQWVYPSPKKQSISVLITEGMLPGFYASFINYNMLNCNTSSQYISVSDAKTKQQFDIKANIPKEWLPDKKVPIQIENFSKSNINYILYISTTKNGGNDLYSFEKYFNQKQHNTIKNWCSINYNKQGYITNNYNNINSFDTPVPITEKSSHLTTQIMLGPYSLNGENNASHIIDKPELSGLVNVKVIGVNIRTGKLFEINQIAKIIDPVTLKTNLPNYLNSEDIVEIPIEINSSSLEKDALHIEILNAKNIEPLSSVNNFLIATKNNPLKFSFVFQAKKIKGTAEFQISVKAKSTQITKDISIPVLSNPSYLTQTGSTVISSQKEWQQTVSPIGIKGSNTAVLEISNAKIPNIWEMLQKFEENSSDNITNLIDKTFPLIYLNNAIDDVDWERQNSEKINKTILQLSKYQSKSGGFVLQSGNIAPDSWLTSYIGEFMLTANQNGYKINEGILNKWKRYQQLELQRLKYSPQASEIGSAYLIYTLSLANSILINQLSEFNNRTKYRLIDRIYLANSYAKLGNDKLAKSVINLDIIGLNINNLDIDECANFLNLSNNLKNNELSLKLMTRLNVLINNKMNSPHTIVMALNSILNTLSTGITHSNIQLKYQINNGKQNPFNSSSPLSYIYIPLDFTLAKNIDVFNMGEKECHVNLSHTGSPQEINTVGTNMPNLQITNKYLTLENNSINTKNIVLNGLYKQVITVKNLQKNSNQNLAVSIPTPSGVELVYSNIPISTTEQTAFTEVIQTQLLLTPLASYEFVLLFKPQFKGQFKSYPIVTQNSDIFNSRTYTQQSNIHVQ